MTEMLSIQNLSKSFAKQTVLDEVSLTVGEGEIFGILGLNGAGKTTLFKCILKLLKTDCGEIIYNGKPIDFNTIHKSIGYLPEFYLPPGELKAREYLDLLSLAVSGNKPDPTALLTKTGLAPDKLIGDFSRGMIQKLGLAIALLKSPDFVILDEPTLGLDPLARKNLIGWLKELNQEGKTILLSSHDFVQVEKLCQNIAVLDQHKIKYCGSISGFITRHDSASLEEAFLKEIGA